MVWWIVGKHLLTASLVVLSVLVTRASREAAISEQEEAAREAMYDSMEM